MVKNFIYYFLTYYGEEYEAELVSNILIFKTYIIIYKTYINFSYIYS